MDIDVHFPTTTAQHIRDKLLAEGCCLLREAIPIDVVLRYKDMTEKLYAELAQNIEAGIKYTDRDRVHITDDKFIAAYGASNSIFNILQPPKFAELLDAIFGKNRYSPALWDSVTRSIDGKDIKDMNSFNPLQIHLDGIYHKCRDAFAINFWVPFEHCGKGTEYPGFSVYPIGHKAIRAITQIETFEALEDWLRERVHEDRGTVYAMLAQKVKEAADAKHIPLLTPTFAIGDVMLITSWTAHGSYYEPGMTKHRRNLEIRYHGDAWDPLIIQ